ncbi:MAG: hypothetical protein AAF630_13755 [Cyanobacteria bacterium P01_C01_bin.38]
MGEIIKLLVVGAFCFLISPLSITNYQLPTTNYQLPTTNYQLPTTNYHYFLINL